MCGCETAFKAARERAGTEGTIDVTPFAPTKRCFCWYSKVARTGRTPCGHRPALPKSDLPNHLGPFQKAWTKPQ